MLCLLMLTPTEVIQSRVGTILLFPMLSLVQDDERRE
jgi:hypothetical protein